MQKTIQHSTVGGAVALVSAVGLLGMALTGCGNTLNGAKQDASTDAQKTSAAADQAAADSSKMAQKAGHEVKDLPQDIDSAAAVTPEVKLSIVRDPVLNNKNNLINVDSHDHVTTLSGHVMSASMKNRASEDAQVLLSKRHPNYKVVNKLTVSGA